MTDPDAPPRLWSSDAAAAEGSRRHKRKLDVTSLSAAAALGGSAGGD